MPSEDAGPDHPPYPETRRRYRRLGIVHALLFGGVPAARLWVEGQYVLGTVAALVFGGAFLGALSEPTFVPADTRDSRNRLLNPAQAQP